jgi:hypothetical protein
MPRAVFLLSPHTYCFATVASPLGNVAATVPYDKRLSSLHLLLSPILFDILSLKFPRFQGKRDGQGSVDDQSRGHIDFGGGPTDGTRADSEATFTCYPEA